LHFCNKCDICNGNWDAWTCVYQEICNGKIKKLLPFYNIPSESHL